MDKGHESIILLTHFLRIGKKAPQNTGPFSAPFHKSKGAVQKNLPFPYGTGRFYEILRDFARFLKVSRGFSRFFVTVYCAWGKVTSGVTTFLISAPKEESFCTISSYPRSM